MVSLISSSTATATSMWLEAIQRRSRLLTHLRLRTHGISKSRYEVYAEAENQAAVQGLSALSVPLDS